MTRLHASARWWRDAVFYQVDVRAFADADGDGVGDLAGVRSRLGYLELLGVDALRLTSSQRAPVVGPRDVDPACGDLAALDALVDDVHAHGLRLTVDLVVQHTSPTHGWFRAALGSGPGSPERARYHFRPGRGPGGELPPDDRLSIAGGPAWTRVPDGDEGPGEWFRHLVGPGRPDLNWSNPEVWADLEKTLRFWLDRGVDGFHVAVDHAPEAPGAADGGDPPPEDRAHDVHRLVRAVLDHFPGRVAVGEARVCDQALFAHHLRPDELHLAVDTRFRRVPFDADAVRAAVEQGLAAVASVGAPPLWTLAGPDASRPVSRYGGGVPGLARARAMALVVLALPGAVFLDNGDELGLPDADPPGGRVPLPWEGGPPGHGFTAGTPSVPIPGDWEQLSAAVQLEDTASTLSLFRAALEMRRGHPGFRGDGVEWFGAPPGCLAFRRTGSTLVCAVNASDASVPLPPGDLLLTSGPLDEGLLPPDTAVYLA